jgi:polyvinyl alcohol dehydrogenase (cytochrome)
VRRHTKAGGFVLSLALLAGAAGAVPAEARIVSPAATCTTDCDWLGYLGGPSHTSATTNGTIRPTDVVKLTSHWRYMPRPTPSPAIYATPATFGNTIYVAGDNGVLAALDETTGTMLWQRDFGYRPKFTCTTGQGIVASPAVRDDGAGNPLVYLNAPDGYLYELDGLTGATVWRALVQIPSATTNDSYAWASPTVYGGRVYVGISSQCDTPFVRGAVKSYDQTTGAAIATFWTLPPGYVGAGVWTSVAVDATGAYITTGSTTPQVFQAHPATPTNAFDEYSMMRLDPVTLQPLGKWPAPDRHFGDPDFGSSPVLFTATIHRLQVPMVGACNKDGYFYAVRTDTMQLVWQRQVGTTSSDGTTACLSGGIWDGTQLFVAGNATTVNGVHVPGSVRKLDPATGAIRWEVAVTSNPLGSGSINGGKLLAYGGTDWRDGPGNGVYIIDVRYHKILRVLPEPGNFPEFAQPIWAGNHLFTARTDALVEWSR